MAYTIVSTQKVTSDDVLKLVNIDNFLKLLYQVDDVLTTVYTYKNDENIKELQEEIRQVIQILEGDNTNQLNKAGQLLVKLALLIQSLFNKTQEN
jgi:hypothetical protein